MTPPGGPGKANVQHLQKGKIMSDPTRMTDMFGHSVPISSVIDAHLSDAEEQGITEPVILFLRTSFPAARDIFEDATGRPLTVPVAPRSWVTLQTVSKDRAITIFRDRAGEAGARAAAILEAEPPPEYWMVEIQSSFLDLFAIEGMTLAYRERIPCDLTGA
jgi:hypothetical protein